MPRRHDVEVFLKRAEIFQRLSAVDRQHVAAASRERAFAKGEVIFREGEPSESVWLVKDGRVHLLHYLTGGRVEASCVMTPGETFCCLPALDRRTYPATAVAATPATVLQIPTTVFHDAMQRSPPMFHEAIGAFCARLRQGEARGCLAHDPVEQRIAQALLALQKKFGEAIPLTRQEIAEIVGTTVETVIRTTRRFQQEGWVRTRRGTIQLLDADALRRLLA